MYVATACFAQVDPASQFAVGWFAQDSKGATNVGVVVYSQRPTIEILDYKIQVLRRSIGGQQESAEQSGLVIVPGSGSDTAGRVQMVFEAGDYVEARVLLNHLQEGWAITDTLTQQIAAAVATTDDPEVSDSESEDDDDLAVDPNFLEIDGLVIDRTLTKSGQDFYQLFFQSWEAPFGARSFSILLEESPFRGRQTVIKVSVDEQLIYQQILQTRYDALEEMAADANSIAFQVLQQRTQAAQNRDGNADEYIEQF